MSIIAENIWLREARSNFNGLVLLYQKTKDLAIKAQIEGVFSDMEDVIKEVKARE